MKLSQVNEMRKHIDRLNETVSTLRRVTNTIWEQKRHEPWATEEEQAWHIDLSMKRLQTHVANLTEAYKPAGEKA
jgi:hypothetical protein|tara:strand:+ start:316 stop:540 length:225 start_codon:yes stop_codon:yes gene_type:complete